MTKNEDVAFTFDPRMLDEALAEGIGFDFEDDEVENRRVTEIDIGAYPKINVGERGDSSTYLEQFLEAVREDYERTGFGSFCCVMLFQRIPDQEDMARFLQAVRARLSDIRAKVPPEKRGFKFVEIEIRMFEGQSVVYCEMARVTDSIFQQIMTERRNKRNAKSTNNHLAKLL